MNIQPIEPKGGGRTLTVYASFDKLVEALGEPEWVAEKNHKVDVEWNVRDLHTGRELQVWNYKNGPNYKGKNGTPVEEIEEWSADGSRRLLDDLGLEYQSIFNPIE